MRVNNRENPRRPLDWLGVRLESSWEWVGAVQRTLATGRTGRLRSADAMSSRSDEQEAVLYLPRLR